MKNRYNFPVVDGKPQPVALFLAQPNGALVGSEKRFKNLEHLCRHAHEVWGFEAVTLPAGKPFADIGKIIREPQYRADLLGQYESWGTPALRFEAHVVGQLTCLHPAELARFTCFADLTQIPRNQRGNHLAYEKAAQKTELQIALASHYLGWTDIVDFSGNRAFTAAKYPWSAYGPLLRLKILVLLYTKHRKTLKLYAKLGLKKCFELHPGEDLNSPWLLNLFREIARRIDGDAVADTIKANADASHETLAGGDAAAQFEYMLMVGLIDTAVHLKDGQVMIREKSEKDKPYVKGGGLITGDYAPQWSKSPRRFATVGCGHADWGRIRPVLKKAHRKSKTGLPLVCELECSVYKDMMQGAAIAAENARRIRAGKPFIGRKHPLRQPQNGTSTNWEEFCGGGDNAKHLLAMTAYENSQVDQLIGQLTGADREFVRENF